MNAPVDLGLTTAAVFVWLGMVLGISFVEAPLKFRAPGITIPLGLGIGRLVFRALNGFEVAFAVVLIGCAVGGEWGATARGLLVIAVVVVLTVGVLVVRPLLNRHSDEVLAAAAAGSALPSGPRSRTHLVYVALEVAKVALLIALGVVLLVG